MVPAGKDWRQRPEHGLERHNMGLWSLVRALKKGMSTGDGVGGGEGDREDNGDGKQQRQEAIPRFRGDREELAVLIEELLTQEGEVRSVPGVCGVHGAENDDAQKDACETERRTLAITFSSARGMLCSAMGTV